ncbi:endonuclease-reverse transcriptase domain-containing protein [Phthorimaea operculella]|nr:endonuclease-reverse transcriptase domain-containing protein [Phthorimaea operculella]
MGCAEAEKTQFWEDIDDLINSISSNEYKIIGGDLNGHVGAKDITRWTAHGGFGMGEINKQGEEILDFASRHSLTLINTNFQKKLEHLITYKCAGRTSQIDFIIADRAIKQKFKDCKVIPGEALTSQHRILVAVYILPKPIKTVIDKTPRTKWKGLDGPKGESLLAAVKEYLEADIEVNYAAAEDMWSKFETYCRAKPSEILGVSKGPLTNGKDPNWWNVKVKETLGNKKELFKKWQSTQSDEDRDQYKEAKKLAKIALNLPEKKGGRGRPPLTWWSNIQRDLKKAQLPEPTTQDRLTWRRKVRRPDPK